MQWYACKFCVALYGLKGSELHLLPTDRAVVETHLRDVHEYPPKTAVDILGKLGSRGAAAAVIEISGPILVVRRLEDLQ
jgi:hypothetical protein